MPVTSPSAKLMMNSFPMNFVSRRYSGFLVRTHWVWKTATTKDRPIVMGTKRKW